MSLGSRARRFVRWAWLVPGLAGCSPIYAPPVRTVHGGAPGRLAPGNMEIGGATAGVWYPSGMGGGTLGYAVRPGLAVATGIDGGPAFTLAWGGIRTPHRWHLSPRMSLAAEAELGAGVGIGGENNCEPNDDECTADDLPWYERPAGGGYLGGAGAFRLGPVSLYTRLRMQLAGAKHVPATQWASAFAGLHFHILDRADIWGGVAFAGYSNGVDSARGLVSEVGLAFRFDPYLGWR